MPDTNYVISGSGQLDTSGTDYNTLNLGPGRTSTAFSTGYCQVGTLAGNGTPITGSKTTLVIHR